MPFAFKFPDIGEGVHEGTILQWKIKPGQRIRQGEILAVIETDKVVAEIPSPKDGIVSRYGAEEGQVIQVGEVLVYLETEREAPVEPATPKKPASPPESEESAAAVGTAPPSKSEEPTTAVESAYAVEPTAPEAVADAVVGKLEQAREYVMPASGEGLIDRSADDVSLTPPQRRTLATPVARKLAADAGIDLSGVNGRGPGGRVMKQDIMDLLARRESAKASGGLSEGRTPEAGVIEVLSTVRKTIARNMEASQRIPAAVVHDFTVVDELVALRIALNRDAGSPGKSPGREETPDARRPSLSYLPFFLKSAGLALKAYPLLNCSYYPERNQYERHGRINIGIAVDTEDGLMVPVIRNLDRLSVVEIQQEIGRLAQAAKGRTIRLEELRGGTFTVSNYGSFAGTYGRPMILPPQVAILGIGRLQQQPVVKEGEVRPAWVLPLSLVFDHRMVDGLYAAGFVGRFMGLVSKPQELLVSLR